jgi:hypothetical protein
VRNEIGSGGSRSLYRHSHRSHNRRTRTARPFSHEGNGSAVANTTFPEGPLLPFLSEGLGDLDDLVEVLSSQVEARAYCLRPSSAPHRGQVPALPAVLPSPTTPNPAFTTRPRAAVREIPRCWASSPSWAHSSSSSLICASCRDISNLGLGDMRRAYYLDADHRRTLPRRLWYASGMSKQSAWVGAAILALAVELERRGEPR